MRIGDVESLTSSRRLARNTVWSLIGQATPVVAAVVAVPHILVGLGTERFGVLTLAWMVVGYFSLFDLGLGWALTRLLAEKLAAERHEEIAPLVWTALAAVAGVGIVGAGVLALTAPVLVHGTLRISPSLEAETVRTFYLLALSVPIVVGSAALTGILAARQHFGSINAVRVPLGVLSYLGPLAVLPFSNSLTTVVGILLAFRLAACIAYLAMCLRAFPQLRHQVVIRASVIPELLRFGGWITVTNLVGPVMVYLDRFLVGSILGATAVAYYATPFDLASRLWLLSSPVVAVLFPAFAATREQDPARTARLFAHGLRYAFVMLFPCALVLLTLAPEGLRWWLGEAFAAHSTRVLQWLLVGVFLNGLAQVALALVQSTGSPAWSARLHLAELPLYLAGAWWLIRAYGIEGAAMAWVARAAVDAIALFIMSGALLKEHTAELGQLGIALTASLALLVTGFFLEGWFAKLGFLAVVLSAVGIAAWRTVVTPVRRGLAAAAGTTRPS